MIILILTTIYFSQVLDKSAQASKDEFEKLETMIRTREMKNKYDNDD